MHVGYIKRMRGLLYGVAINLFNIRPSHRDHINDAELKDLNTSMIDIGHRASANYKGLCIWEDSITRANLELQTAIKAIQEEKDRRQLGATQIANCDHANITLDCNYLEEEITEHKNYLTAEDHVITKGMRMRKLWREQMEKITKDLSDIIATVNNNNKISKTNQPYEGGNLSKPCLVSPRASIWRLNNTHQQGNIRGK